ncbi:MAG: flagellar hook-length control protein FliK [Paracoccaceae bacterium]
MEFPANLSNAAPKSGVASLLFPESDRSSGGFSSVFAGAAGPRAPASEAASDPSAPEEPRVGEPGGQAETKTETAGVSRPMDEPDEDQLTEAVLAAIDALIALLRGSEGPLTQTDAEAIREAAGGVFRALEASPAALGSRIGASKSQISALLGPVVTGIGQIGSGSLETVAQPIDPLLKSSGSTPLLPITLQASDGEGPINATTQQGKETSAPPFIVRTNSADTSKARLIDSVRHLEMLLARGAQASPAAVTEAVVSALTPSLQSIFGQEKAGGASISRVLAELPRLIQNALVTLTEDAKGAPGVGSVAIQNFVMRAEGESATSEAQPLMARLSFNSSGPKSAEQVLAPWLTGGAGGASVARLKAETQNTLAGAPVVSGANISQLNKVPSVERLNTQIGQSVNAADLSVSGINSQLGRTATLPDFAATSSTNPAHELAPPTLTNLSSNVQTSGAEATLPSHENLDVVPTAPAALAKAGPATPSVPVTALSGVQAVATETASITSTQMPTPSHNGKQPSAPVTAAASSEPQTSATAPIAYGSSWGEPAFASGGGSDKKAAKVQSDLGIFSTLPPLDLSPGAPRPALGLEISEPRSAISFAATDAIAPDNLSAASVPGEGAAKVATETSVAGRGGEPAIRHIAPQLAGAIQPQTVPGHIQLQLDPPELGRVEIGLEIADQGLRASLAAERGSTADLLRRHGDLLLQQLQDLGFADIDLRFSGGRGFGERQSTDVYPLKTEAITEPEEVGTLPRSLVNHDGIDLRV